MTLTPGDVEVHGWVAPGFERVRAEFERVADDAGSQLAVYVDRALVVDLWTSAADDGDLIGPVFSCTKGAVHLAAALMVQDGLLDPDRRVCDYWQAFAAAGKQEVTVRQLLSHQAGLLGVPDGFSAAELADDVAIAERLAAQRPWWEPGTAYGYHALTLGALVGELVRRVAARPLGELLVDRMPTPDGATFFLGMPEDLDAWFRPALPMASTPASAPAAPAGTSAELRGVAFNQVGREPTSLLEYGNSVPVRRYGPGSAGGMANARGLAGLYAVAVTGVGDRLAVLGDKTVTEFARPHTFGTDLVTGRTDRFALGFEAASRKYPGLRGRAVGHSGASGSEAFADPDLGVAYGFTRTRMAGSGGGEAPENHHLVSAVVESITTP